jgi:quercetin dioxygenase-like cupin family protein
MSNVHVGNVSDEGDKYRGWIVGHFITPPDPVRTTNALEVKWGVHPTGQQRDAWTNGEARTTLLLLISGRFRLDLATGSTVLCRQGDYVTWGPGTDHSWQAEEDSLVVSIRWPSVAD